MRNTLKNNAKLSKVRKPNMNDFKNCRPLQVFKTIDCLVEMNGGHASILYQDGYPRVVLPISRICEKDNDSISISYNYLYKLKHIAARSKVPSMRFIKHLGIYAHNAKRRYNA